MTVHSIKPTGHFDNLLLRILDSLFVAVSHGLYTETVLGFLLYSKSLDKSDVFVCRNTRLFTSGLGRLYRHVMGEHSLTTNRTASLSAAREG